MNVYDLIAEHYSGLFRLKRKNLNLYNTFVRCRADCAMQAVQPVNLQWVYIKRDIIYADST